jgi:hypothetical protein
LIDDLNGGGGVEDREFTGFASVEKELQTS